MNIVPFNTENPPLYFKKIWSLQKCSKSSSVFLNNKKKLYWHIVKQINGGDTLGGVYIRGIIYLFMVRLEFAKKRPNLRSRGRKFPDKKRGTLWRCENHKVFLSFFLFVFHVILSTDNPRDEPNIINELCYLCEACYTFRSSFHRRLLTVNMVNIVFEIFYYIGPAWDPLSLWLFCELSVRSPGTYRYILFVQHDWWAHE